jgi:ADP-ribosylglycohydrolase
MAEVVMTVPDETERIIGVLVGTAVGDAVGLPAEGCSRRRIDRRFPGPWRHRLVGHWGMCSDDTEHTFLVARALLIGSGDVERFRRSLAWGLRWWFLSLPAGIGLGTAQACLRLWLGWPPARAGVWSAGNGPAMRAAILGAMWAEDPEVRRDHVLASTILTHRDPRASTAALAVAELTALWMHGCHDAATALTTLRALAPDDGGWNKLLDQVAAGLDEGLDARQMADRLGLSRGITGYAYHTVSMVVFTALRFGTEPRLALEQLWGCGGDTDTTGAILGGILGARHGPAAFPADWVAGIRNGPLSLDLLRSTGARLARRDRSRPCRWWWPLVPLRNLVFLLIILAHGLRRMLP